MNLSVDPKANVELFGHSAAETLLRRCAASDRLHHAWLFTGAEGIGKATLAYRFARALLAGLPTTGLHVDAQHPVSRQVAAGSHPDLVTIALGWDPKKGRDRKEIGRDETERLFDLFALTAAGGGWRIVVVDGVDQLNRHAANAILKLLEEPPRQAIFLLTTPAPSRLPTTLRSRCIRLPLRPLGEEDMRQALRASVRGGDNASFDELVRLGEGSPGKALRIAGQHPVELCSLEGLARELGLATGFAEPSMARAIIHRSLRETIFEKEGHRPEPFDRGVSSWCSSWSVIGKLEDDCGTFNLDKDQLVFDTAQVVSR